MPRKMEHGMTKKTAEGSGQGIPAEVQGQVLERDFRPKDNRKGSKGTGWEPHTA